MEDIAKVLEKYNLKKSSETFRKEMAMLNQPSFTEEKLLGVLRKALVNKEKRQLREEVKKLHFDYKPLKYDNDTSFNKEETEAVMERLMNRIVANPKLINEDTELNHRIEKIFNLEAFQKMVENADIFQDLSSSSVFDTSKMLEKSIMSHGSNAQNILAQASSHHISNTDSVVSELKVPHSENKTPEKTSKERHDAIDKEHVRSGQKAQKSRKEDKEKFKNIPKEEKAHTKSHEEKAPMKNRDSIVTDKEESKKVSDDIFQGMHDNESQSIHSTHTVHNEDLIDEYTNDEDPGFISIEVKKEDMEEKCHKIAVKYGFPELAFRQSTENEIIEMKKRKLKKEALAISKKKNKNKAKDKEDDGEGEDDDIPTLLPKWVRFSPGDDDFYPAEFNGVVYDCYNLKIVFDREKTGFEETREFQIVYNSIIGGRYQVMEYLGSAAFSKAIRCFDLHTNEEVCMKIIENNKDYFDQSIDEIKLLRYIKTNCDDCDAKNIIRMIDFFYHKEHLFIVTELLKDNLYEFYKYNREQEDDLYFTLGRLQKVTTQILEALDYMHSLNLVHCDLKPENILMKSYSQCKVKVIDLGSS